MKIPKTPSSSSKIVALLIFTIISIFVFYSCKNKTGVKVEDTYFEDFSLIDGRGITPITKPIIKSRKKAYVRASYINYEETEIYLVNIKTDLKKIVYYRKNNSKIYHLIFNYYFPGAIEDTYTIYLDSNRYSYSFGLQMLDSSGPILTSYSIQTKDTNILYHALLPKQDTLKIIDKLSSSTFISSKFITDSLIITPNKIFTLIDLVTFQSW